MIDCSPIAQPAVPVCYSPSQHPQLASDGGRSLFITFTRMGTYDVVAYQVELGPPGRSSAAAECGAPGRDACSAES